MDFILPIDEEIKELLKNNHINDVTLYVFSNIDFNMNYNKVHYVIANNSLYIFDNFKKLLYEFNKKDIKEIKIDYLLNYGKIMLVKNDDSVNVIGFFEKEQTKVFSLFERLALKALSLTLSEEDYQSKEILNIKKDEEKNKKHINKNTFFRLFKYIKKYKLVFFTIVFILILSALLGVFMPILTGQILYNEILAIDGRWYGKVLLFISFYLSLKIISTIITMIYGRIVAKVSANICYDIKCEVFSSMQKLSLSFFNDKETGNLMNRVVWDSNMIFYYIVDDIPYFCTNLLQIIGVYIYLLFLNPLLSLLVFIPLPFVVAIFIKASPIFKRNWHQNNNRNSELNDIVSDTLEGFRVVKVFSASKKETDRFEDISRRNNKVFKKNSIFTSFIRQNVSFLISLSLFAVWGYGGYMVATSQNFDYGDLSTFIGGLDLLYAPLERLTDIIFVGMPRVLNSAGRIFEIIDADIEVNESEKPIELENIHGDIEFKNVSFSYEANKEILKNISFKVLANTSLGIVGETGAGKSTLMNLLARLYDVNDGKILIDGVNIKDLSFKTLHKNVSMISQDTYLFKGSILENIRYAKPDATFDEVINAARMANAHDFIIKLQDGYDTIIGQGEVNLSGGERQRLSIARAILLNSKIIIFDEATSAMDSITEHLIQQSIKMISQGRTILMIAHRLSTLKDVDQLIVIDNKKIVEQGTMQDLIKQNGKFAKLYNIQQEALKHIRIGD
ncbi:MAG: ABC transporter ATP-binding protein/permease [Erysipelotrichaceae bacterium]|nr:ABC transporter ATP-binding protein/permease [Erysipelotrichaceae bacterium]